MQPRIVGKEMKRIPEADCFSGSSLRESTGRQGADQAPLVAPYAFTNSTAHGMEVIYLALSPGNTARHADDLRAFGFEVAVYPSIAAVCAALPVDASPLIAVQAEASAIHLAVAQLRLAFRHAGIVVIADFPDRLSRVGAMLSGADSCVEAMPDSLELMAALLASKRRLQVEEARPKDDGGARRDAGRALDGGQAASRAAGEAAPTDRWHLENYGWVLVAPDGTRLELNHSERKIMAQFFNNPQEPLTRLSQGASYDPESGKIARGLDVAISRLRKKAAECAVRLPIRSIRGKGYVFVSNDPLDIELQKMKGARS